jgi:hypothetical protein
MNPELLAEKFKTVGEYGPLQLSAFHHSPDRDERERHARRAFELVQRLLRDVGAPANVA